MATFCAQRAATCDRVYFKPERQADLRLMEAGLAAPFVDRHMLEIACGTGWWTPHGAARAAHWRATELNPNTMAVAQAKPAMPGVVRFQTVDAYSLAELDDLPAPAPAPALACPRGAAPALGRPGVQRDRFGDGSTHKVLKNFPTPEQAIATLGPRPRPRARDAQWTAHTHYWVLRYTLT